MFFDAAFQDSANLVSSGEKAKARDLIAALRILKSGDEAGLRLTDDALHT